MPVKHMPGKQELEIDPPLRERRLLSLKRKKAWQKYTSKQIHLSSKILGNLISEFSKCYNPKKQAGE